MICMVSFKSVLVSFFLQSHACTTSVVLVNFFVDIVKLMRNYFINSGIMLYYQYLDQNVG